MNVPNSLTSMRFILSPVYVFCFFQSNAYIAISIVVIAGLTDILDGYLARRYKLVTQLGAVLDPLADKVFMISVVITFMIAQNISWILGLLICLREVIMIAIGVVLRWRTVHVLPADIYGKVTTTLYYCSFLMVLLAYHTNQQNNISILIPFLVSLQVSIHYTRELLRQTKKA